MNNVVGRFETVSYSQYNNDLQKIFDKDGRNTEVENAHIGMSYNDIILPYRATAGSAGYDIRTPIGFTLKPGEDVLIPTGLRCSIKPGWFLMIVPRSGLGFKYYTRLANTAGIIDSDYYNAKNEGHIMIKLRMELGEGANPLVVQPGDAIAQAIFLPFGVTEEDAADGVRTGGLGSTGGVSQLNSMAVAE